MPKRFWRLQKNGSAMAPFPKINHEGVKSAGEIEPTEIVFRPAREPRCPTVPVRIPSRCTTTPMTMAARRSAPPPHPSPKEATADEPRGSGYTIVHAGKQVRVGPVVFWIVVGTIVAARLWSAATATYFAFRDDVLTRLIARQTEMQYAYEDRIAEMRAQVDRITSRQLLDQEQFEQKLDQLMRRQTTLESRANALGALPDRRHHRLDRQAAARGAGRPIAAPFGHAETVADQRHGDLRGAARSRGPAGVAHPDR